MANQGNKLPNKLLKTTQKITEKSYNVGMITMLHEDNSEESEKEEEKRVPAGHAMLMPDK